jgi:hypothetical protein
VIKRLGTLLALDELVAQFDFLDPG